MSEAVEGNHKNKTYRGIEVPTFYGVHIGVYEEDGKYYLHSYEWVSYRIEISEEFYHSWINECQANFICGKWEDMKRRDDWVRE